VRATLYTVLNAQNPKCLTKSEDKKEVFLHLTFAICLLRTSKGRRH
jgi:hypothetical protein